MARVARNRHRDYLRSLLRELRALPAETEWVEFKVDQAKPQLIGEYIAALANAAALQGKVHGYLVWGVADQTHEAVGTRFSPRTTTVGNEPLEAWLARLLEPRVDFRFHEIETDDRRFVLLEVDAATRQPVSFRGVEYIRIGSAKRRLGDFPEKERALWRLSDRTTFEEGIAAERVDGKEVLLLLDYPAYFHLLGLPPADGRDATLEVLEQDRLIQPSEAGGYDITNLGAILLARNLADFRRGVWRKALRVVQYRGRNRLSALGEYQCNRGYAAGFEEAMAYIIARLPTEEVNGGAFQRTIPEFPEVAVRELLANTLIHQDFSVTGTGPTVEIFDGRMEFTNAGEPLLDAMRFLDGVPRSRNEALASLMRRFNLCEERGTGIDKAVAEVERYNCRHRYSKCHPAACERFCSATERSRRWTAASACAPAICTPA